MVFAAVAGGVWLSHAVGGAGETPGPFIGDAPVSALLFGLSGLVASSVLLLPGRWGRAAVLLSCALLGAGVERARLHERPRDDLLRIIGPGPPGEPHPLVRLEGRAVSSPGHGPPRAGVLTPVLPGFEGRGEFFTMRVDTLLADAGPRRVSGVVNVYADGLGRSGVEPGRRVRVVGLLHRPAPAMNPGGTDRLAWANQSGRAGWVRAGDVEVLGSPGGLAGVFARLGALPSRAHGAAVSRLEGPARDILVAMLLGERSPGDAQSAVFARAGVSHLLAISGFHLAVLVALTVGIVRLLDDRPGLEVIIGLLTVGMYVAVVPARTPILRAALLASVLLVAHFFGRRWDRLALLGWIAALLVLVRPLDLLTLGFQLTIGVTALLLWLSGTRHHWVFGRGSRFIERTPRAAAVDRARALAATSLIVWLASAPVILFHTGSFNPLTPIAVIAATPPAVITQILGMAGLIAGLFSAGLGSWLLAGANAAASGLGAVASLFDVPMTATTLAPVSAAWAAAGVGAVVYALQRARIKDIRPWAVLGLVLVWFAAEQAVHSSLRGDAAARVDMLGVGDGSCLLVRAGREAMFWDAGSLTPGLGVREIPRAVRALGAARVPVAVVTHANTDHYGALPDLARAVGLRRVYVSAPELQSMQQAPPGSPEALFLDSMRAQGVEVRPIARGDELRLGPATLRVLWPPGEPPPGVDSHNDRCVVARLDAPTAGGLGRILLTGDIGEPAMRGLIGGGGAASDDAVAADILELPHHGGHHAFSERFVRAVAPAVVLQSTGPSRLGDRRWDAVKQWLRARGGLWRVTARDGAVWAEILNDGSVRAGAVRVRVARARRTGGSR
ncbi:MAG TPA: ComEC/Rec2 family competence protein [Phycisphaerales bacterium]|nr:ComEC/Rec2 family competence protein [Phycisphaerales bacterium]